MKQTQFATGLNLSFIKGKVRLKEANIGRQGGMGFHEPQLRKAMENAVRGMESAQEWGAFATTEVELTPRAQQLATLYQQLARDDQSPRLRASSPLLSVMSEHRFEAARSIPRLDLGGNSKEEVNGSFYFHCEEEGGQYFGQGVSE
jgi:hypothetical protein